MILNKDKILQMIMDKAENQLEGWTEEKGIPMSQNMMESLHYDTGRLTASIHQEDRNHIIIGGTAEAPTARDDGKGYKVVNYAIYVEARFAPVRGEIIPMLEQATGGTAQ